MEGRFTVKGLDRDRHSKNPDKSRRKRKGGTKKGRTCSEFSSQEERTTNIGASDEDWSG